jgi:hypothetical protein
VLANSRTIPGRSALAAASVQSQAGREIAGAIISPDEEGPAKLEFCDVR